jgi:hypothetical protein
MIKLDKLKLKSLRVELEEVTKLLMEGQITDENIRKRNNISTQIQTMIENDKIYNSKKNLGMYYHDIVIFGSNKQIIPSDD